MCGAQCNTLVNKNSVREGDVCALWVVHSLSLRVNGLVVTISACLSCSDDEDVAPLSAKFADIYPLSNYDDTEVVANMNGIHSELNGGGENMALKDEVWVQLLPGDNKWHKMVIWHLIFLYSCVLKSINDKGCF